MKKYISYILIAALTLPFILGAYMEYPQDQWYLVRASVDHGDNTPDDALGETTSQWADWSSTWATKSYRVPSGAKTIAFTFASTTDADAATIIVYAVHQGGPIEYVCSYNLVAGTMDTDDATPLNYIDTMTLVNDRWPKTTWTADADGSNGVAKLCMNTIGARYFLVLVTAVTPAATHSVTTIRATYWQ
jgi:hypothetical protein